MCSSDAAARVTLPWLLDPSVKARLQERQHRAEPNDRPDMLMSDKQGRPATRAKKLPVACAIAAQQISSSIVAPGAIAPSDRRALPSGCPA